MSDAGPLEFLFNPASVAMVGASATPGKIGSRIVDHLLDNGFPGKVFPVNPGAGTIRGLTCYPDISAIPEPVDVAYVLVPADAAVEATWQLGRAGARAAIIAAAGFAETNTNRGRAREASLMSAAAATGIRIVGPNCNGIYNAADSVSIGFNTAHALAHPPGGMGVLSHSGALFSTLMLRAHQTGVGLSKFASVGNEADLDVLDFMEDLACDEATTCICLIIDSLPDGRRFADLAATARERGKRIVALKLGTSAEGASAAVAHSSRLAGRAEAYAALFRHCSVGVVDTVEQLVSAAALAGQTPAVPPMPRIGAVTMSGGAGTIVADSAARHGVSVPALSSAALERIHKVAPGSPVVNPVDMGATSGRIDLGGILGILREDANIDVVLHYYHPMANDKDRLSRAEILAASRRASRKPHILLAPGGLTEPEESFYQYERITVLSDTDVCMAALAAAGPPAPPVGQLLGGGGGPGGRPIAAQGLPAQAGPLGDVTSLAILQAAGLPTARFLEAGSPAGAAAAATELGYPVVVKGLATGLAHKSDQDLVVTGVADAAQCESESARLLAAGATSLLVQPQVHANLEALAGLITEPNLGRFAVFGLGGIYAESLADTAIVPVEASHAEIASALSRTRLGAILRSARFRVPGAFDLMTEILARLADFGRHAGPRLEAVDMNPLMISRDGIVAVDALIVLAGEQTAAMESARARRRTA